MKKLLLLGAGLLLCTACQQTGQSAQNELDSLRASIATTPDSVAYRMGLAQAEQLRQWIDDGIDSANINNFLQGMHDGVQAFDRKDAAANKAFAYAAGYEAGKYNVSDVIAQGIQHNLYGNDTTRQANVERVVDGLSDGVLQQTILPAEQAMAHFQQMMIAAKGSKELRETKAFTDSLAYYCGLAQAAMLKGYMHNTVGVDTACTADFLDGMRKGACKSSVEESAYVQGFVQGAMSVGKDIVGYLNFKLFGKDRAQGVNPMLVFLGINDGLRGKADISSEEASQWLTQIFKTTEYDEALAAENDSIANDNTTEE